MKPVDKQLEILRERPDRAVLQHQIGETAENQHAGKSDDEGRNFLIGDPVALGRADQSAENQTQRHDDREMQAPLDQHDRRKAAGEGDDRADGKVDMARNDDQQHAERHDDDERILQHQVGEVDGPEKNAARHDLEEQHDDDECDEQAVFADVASLR